MRRIGLAGAALAALSALAACAPRALPPAPVPPPPPAPAPPPAPMPPPVLAWQDGPLAPGDWTWADRSGASQAVFVSPSGPLFAISCEPGGQIVLRVIGAAAGPIAIATSFGERTLAGTGAGMGAGNPGADQAMARLPAADPLLDQMVFSRGRFLVRAGGSGDLVLPSWPEPARVIEDCRA
jgi:hypothetical protein